jgi:hypothetical protein
VDVVEDFPADYCDSELTIKEIIGLTAFAVYPSHSPEIEDVLMDFFFDLDSGSVFRYTAQCVRRYLVVTAGEVTAGEPIVDEYDFASHPSPPI